MTSRITTVVNVRDLDPKRRKDTDTYIYIGSGDPHKGLKQSIFYNRFKTIEEFREDFYQKLEKSATFKKKIQSLKGKTLVCHCKPEPCHGDVIKEYLDQQENSSPIDSYQSEMKKSLDWVKSQGLNVIPVPYKQKRAVIPWKRGKKNYQKEQSTDDERNKWFVGRESNIAVVCGEVSNNLLVLDADNRELALALKKNFPKTNVVSTSKGLHFYYFLDESVKKGRIEFASSELVEEAKKFKTKKEFNEFCTEHEKEFIAVDVQAEGAYAICPPSIHPDGPRYTFNSCHPITKGDFNSLLEILNDTAKEFNIEAIRVKGKEEKTSSFFKVDEKFKYKKKKKPTKKDRTRRAKIEYNSEDLINYLPSLETMIGFGGPGPHPTHGSDTGQNLNVDVESQQWYCFRCDSGGGKLQWFAVQEGIIDCSEASSMSKEDYNKTFRLIKKRYGIKDYSDEYYDEAKKCIKDNAIIMLLMEANHGIGFDNATGAFYRYTRFTNDEGELEWGKRFVVGTQLKLLGIIKDLAGDQWKLKYVNWEKKVCVESTDIILKELNRNCLTPRMRNVIATFLNLLTRDLIDKERFEFEYGDIWVDEDDIVHVHLKEEYDHSIKEILQMLNEVIAISTYPNGVAAQSLYHLISPLSFFIRGKGKLFPYQSLEGASQAGKTSHCTLFLCKGFAMDISNAKKHRNEVYTLFTYTKALDANGDTRPLLMDDIDADFFVKHAEELKGAAMSQIIGKRGRPDQSVLTYWARRQPIFSMNCTLDVELAQQMRFMRLRYTREHTQKQNSGEWEKAVKKLPLGFLYPLHKKLWNGKVLEDIIDEIYPLTTTVDLGKILITNLYKKLLELYVEVGVPCTFKEPEIVMEKQNLWEEILIDDLLQEWGLIGIAERSVSKENREYYQYPRYNKLMLDVKEEEDDLFVIYLSVSGFDKWRSNHRDCPLKHLTDIANESTGDPPAKTTTHRFTDRGQQIVSYCIKLTVDKRQKPLEEALKNTKGSNENRQETDPSSQMLESKIEQCKKELKTPISEIYGRKTTDFLDEIYNKILQDKELRNEVKNNEVPVTFLHINARTSTKGLLNLSEFAEFMVSLLHEGRICRTRDGFYKIL